MRKKRKFRIENFFKENQYTISTTGVLLSLAFSSIAIYFSYRADSLTKKQAELNSKPNFGFHTNLIDSTREISTIDFVSLKDYMHLENIELFFPNDFENDTTEILDGTSWRVSNFRDQVANVIEQHVEFDSDYMDEFYIHKVSFDIPIVVRYNYIEYGKSKKYSVFYLVKTTIYNHRVVRIKGFYFKKEISDDIDLMKFLDNYNLYYGYRKEELADSSTVDSVLLDNANFKQFYKFLFNNCYVTSLKMPMYFQQKIVDSFEFHIPAFYVDSNKFSKFHDSLNYFLSSQNNFIRSNANSIDSFVKANPFCFKNYECNLNNEWTLDYTHIAYLDILFEMIVKDYLSITKEDKIYQD